MLKRAVVVVNHLTFDNYFALFSLDKIYDIDLKYLESKYFELINIYHPDNNVYLSDSDKISINNNSSIINKAYNILKDRFSRIDYMLSINNIDINDDSEIKTDDILLFEIFQYQEKLESIKNNLEKNDLKKTINDKIEESIYEFNSFYNENNFQFAKTAAIRIRYLNKIILKLKNIKCN